MVKTLAQTHTANIYGIYKDNRLIGTIENKLCGPDCGLHAYTISAHYTKADIKQIYRKEKELC